jgi:5-methylcytosine-specific restriction enzyme B
MTTTSERNIPRLREVLAYIDASGGSAHRQGILDHVAERFPPTDEDLQPIPNGHPRWENMLLWSTTGLVKAGWASKDGRGVWTITDAGRMALSAFPDPMVFRNEVERLYSAWNTGRKAQQRRAWLIRGSSVLGANLVPGWLDGGWVSLAASQLREISPDISAEDLAAAAAEDYDHLKFQELKSKVDEILAFVTRIKPGDVVTTTNEGALYIGDVTGGLEWQHSEEGRSNLRRTVEWRNPDSPVDFTDLPAPLPAKLRSGSSVIDLTAELELIESLTLPPDDDRVEAGPTPELAVHEHLPQPTAELAEGLFIDLAWLQRVRDLLDERRQVVLYGPPGTGKTFLAQKLAEHLVGGEQVRLVQFHPAYSYEDFFEGYRPEEGPGGTVGFKLRAGPLRRLANDASDHPDLAFVLIIDEINRADLAKVFGELYFLLEYRTEAVQLMYSGGEENFTLPANLYLIGTMNTADRSIALVDGAMRRRFGFVGLDMAPGSPTAALLRRWSAANDLPPVAADLLDELNRRLDDPEFQVGPSYFMKRVGPEAFGPARLAAIWDSDILPLLAEHYYGQWEAVKGRFALASLLKAIERQAAGEAGDGESVEESGQPEEPTFAP